VLPGGVWGVGLRIAVFWFQLVFEPFVHTPSITTPATPHHPPKRQQEVWYQLGFEGFPPSEAEWYPASRVQRDHAHGAQLIGAYETALKCSEAAADTAAGPAPQQPEQPEPEQPAAAPSPPPQPEQQGRRHGKQAKKPAAAGSGDAPSQPLPSADQAVLEPVALALPPLAIPLAPPSPPPPAAAAAAPPLLPEEHLQQHDIPQLVDEHGNILQLLGPDGLPLPPEQAAAIAAQAIAQQAAAAVAEAEDGGKRDRGEEGDEEGYGGGHPKRLKVPDGTAMEMDGQMLHLVPLQVGRWARVCVWGGGRCGWGWAGAGACRKGLQHTDGLARAVLTEEHPA